MDFYQVPMEIVIDYQLHAIKLIGFKLLPICQNLEALKLKHVMFQLIGLLVESN